MINGKLATVVQRAARAVVDSLPAVAKSGSVFGESKEEKEQCLSSLLFR